ncbi:BRCA1-associated RING domain protein 1-like isoform X2 [Phymastichus coffea]|nr:BRCA1-associated RING domain protein 1-like isoform X2 [Phymastichus coffea]
MQILTCNKCKKRLSNPKQFLNCGHFACSKCVGHETDCVQCRIPNEASDVHSDTTMNDIIINLNVIAESVGYLKENKFENSKSPSEVSIDDCNQSLKSKTSHRSRISENIPKNINKKNSKGETALHVACCYNQIERVKKLLEAGANPNTKDHAGWTPLQEAVSYEYVEVCKLLLNADAQPNMYGCDNRTALHEAAIADNVELVSLLIQSNADNNVFDRVGKKPINYCKSKEIFDLLESLDRSTEEQSRVSHELHKTVNVDKTVDETINTTIILYGSKNLKQQNRKLLIKMGNEKKGIKVVNHLSSSVTYVVVDTENPCNITYSLDVLFAVLYGKILLNSDGLPVLMESSNISPADCKIFEVNPPQLNDSITRSRNNILLQRPKLFNNCYFYFAIKQHDVIEYDTMSIEKDDLMKLVAAGDGKVLPREPKPDDVQGSLSPFHVANNPKHALHKCTHYIIYMPENNQPIANRIMYNMPMLKTLPLMWFIESILRFELIDPVDMGLVDS